MCRPGFPAFRTAKCNYGARDCALGGPPGVARERGLQVGVRRKMLAALFMSCLWLMFG